MPKAIFIGDPKAENQTLGNMLRIHSEYHQTAVLDALACYLHNEGHSLNGNKAENDELWLARTIHTHMGHSNNWEQATTTEREEALRLARISIKCLPMLCERIAQRYINAAAGVRSMHELIEARRTSHLRRGANDQ